MAVLVLGAAPWATACGDRGQEVVPEEEKICNDASVRKAARVCGEGYHCDRDSGDCRATTPAPTCNPSFLEVIHLEDDALAESYTREDVVYVARGSEVYLWHDDGERSLAFTVPAPIVGIYAVQIGGDPHEDLVIVGDDATYVAEAIVGEGQFEAPYVLEGAPYERIDKVLWFDELGSLNDVFAFVQRDDARPNFPDWSLITQTESLIWRVMMSDPPRATVDLDGDGYPELRVANIRNQRSSDAEPEFVSTTLLWSGTTPREEDDDDQNTPTQSVESTSFWHRVLAFGDDGLVVEAEFQKFLDDSYAVVLKVLDEQLDGEQLGRQAKRVLQLPMEELSEDSSLSALRIVDVDGRGGLDVIVGVDLHPLVVFYDVEGETPCIQTLDISTRSAFADGYGYDEYVHVDNFVLFDGDGDGERELLAL